MDFDSSKFHFRILQDIAQDLSGEVNFPTCLDAALVVRNILKETDVSLDKVAQAVGVEPLIASRLLRLSNSIAYNPSGKAIADLKIAIGRLGFETVRTASLAVAMDQMLKSRHLAAFEDLSRLAWEHSLQVAAISRVLARRLGRINPEEALLAGMVHEIGVFYLLYRAAEYPEYRENPDALLELVVGWHEGIGESLMHALGLPESIIQAVADHKRLRDNENPCNLGDVLYFANLLAGDSLENMAAPTVPEQDETRSRDRERFADLLDEAQEDIGQLKAALAA